MSKIKIALFMMGLNFIVSICLGQISILQNANQNHPITKLREISNPNRNYTTVAFHPNADVIIAAAENNKLYVFDTKEKKLFIPSIPIQHVNSVSFSPNGQHLAISGSETTLIMDVYNEQDLFNEQFYMEWMNQSEGSENTFSFGGSFSSFTPDSQTLAIAGGSNGQIAILNTNTKEYRHLTHGLQVVSLDFSSDGTTMASASIDGTIRVWDTLNFEVLATIKTDNNHLPQLRFHQNSNQLIYSNKNLLIMNDWKSDQTKIVIDLGSNYISNFALDAQGKIVVIGTQNETFKFIHLDTGLTISGFKDHPNSLNYVVFSHDNRQLATASKGKIIIWDYTSTILEQQAQALINQKEAERLETEAKSAYLEDLKVRLTSDPTYILSVARDGSLEDIQVAINLGIDLNYIDSYGQSVLMYAAGNNSSEVLAALIDAGALVNSTTYEGWTAIMFAARDNLDSSVTATLIQRGADVFLVNSSGQTAFDLAVNSSNSIASQTIQNQMNIIAQEQQRLVQEQQRLVQEQQRLAEEEAVRQQEQAEWERKKQELLLEFPNIQIARMGGITQIEAARKIVSMIPESKENLVRFTNFYEYPTGSSIKSHRAAYQERGKLFTAVAFADNNSIRFYTLNESNGDYCQYEFPSADTFDLDTFGLFTSPDYENPNGIKRVFNNDGAFSIRAQTGVKIKGELRALIMVVTADNKCTSFIN